MKSGIESGEGAVFTSAVRIGNSVSDRQQFWNTQVSPPLLIERFLAFMHKPGALVLMVLNGHLLIDSDSRRRCLRSWPMPRLFGRVAREPH